MATKRLLNAVQNPTDSKRVSLSRKRLRSMIQVGQLVPKSTLLERSEATSHESLDLRTDKEKAALLLWVPLSCYLSTSIVLIAFTEIGR
jgi:hypothetical protein